MCVVAPFLQIKCFDVYVCCWTCITSILADWGKIFKWLKEEECDGSVRLLYRASRDGFSHTTFRKKCSNKGPTLTPVLLKTWKACNHPIHVKCQTKSCGHCQHPYSLVATLIISRAVWLSTNQATDFDQKYITIPVLLQFSLIPMNLESYKYVHV